MTTFAELFPDHPLAKPFAPPEPEIYPEVQQAHARARRALGAQSQPDPYEWQPSQGMAVPTGETEWGDTAKALTAGLGDIGSMGAGLGEHLAGKVAGEGSTPLEQGALDLQNWFARGRRASTDFAQAMHESMSPEAQQRAAREILTLDPNRTIWQGDIGEFISSINLKMMRSAPSTLAAIVPYAILSRIGLGGGALTSLGATEAAFSAGSVAANTATEIEQASEADLMKSQFYAGLRQQGISDEEARRQLIVKAQGLAPEIAGVVSGAIGLAAGRYLQPVFVDKPAGILSRAARGYLAEGPLTEAPQSMGEQVAQNYAAQMYDADRRLSAGVGEAGVQGALVGGPMGAGTAVVFGQGPQAIPSAQPGAQARAQAIPSAPGAQAGAGVGAAAPTGAQPSAPPPMPTGRPGMPPPAGQSYAPTPTDWQWGPEVGTYLGGDIERQGEPPEYETTTGQRLIQMEPVDPAISAAMNARRDQKIPDMFEDPEQIARQQQQAFMRGEIPAPPQPPGQYGMELPQAPINVRGTRGVPQVAPQAGQLSLPMQRERGLAPQPLTPMPGPRPAPEEVAPAGYSLAQPPTGELQAVPPKPASRTRNRADKLRERAAIMAANQATGLEREVGPQGESFPGRVERYAGTMLHPGQRSIFDEEAPAPTASQQTNRQVGFQVTATDASGTFYESPILTQEQADKQVDQLYKEFPGAQIEMMPLREKTSPQMLPDHPSAEPVRDLEAQLQDLADPDNPRLGVYVPPDNMDQLADLSDVGVPLANFATRGDALIAKNNAVANELVAMKREGIPMQAILGYATGAGEGKMLGANVAVQQRDVEGNVTRESAVPPEQVARTVGEMTEPGRQVVITTPEQVIGRRVARIQEEQQAADVTRKTRETRRRAGELAERGLPEPAAEVVKEVLSEGELTPETAGIRTLSVSAKLRARERAKRKIKDVGQPSEYTYYEREITQTTRDLAQAKQDLVPRRQDAESKSRKEAAPARIKVLQDKLKELKASAKKAGLRDTELYDRLTDAEMQAELASGNAEEAKRARERASHLRQLLALHRRAHSGRTLAEEMAHVAGQISPKATRTVRQRAVQRGFREETRHEEIDTEDSSVRQRLESLTDEEIRDLPEHEIDELFLAAANIMSSHEVQKGTAKNVDLTGKQQREVAAAQATNVTIPVGPHVQDLLREYDTPSERKKLIFRARRVLSTAEQERAGTAPITAEVGEKVTKAKEGEPSKAKRKRIGKFHPQALLDRQPPRELSQEKAQQHAAQVERIFGTKNKKGMLSHMIDSLQKLQAKLYGPEGSKIANKAEPGGNPPHDARNMIYGREYLRTLIQYGEMMQELRPESTNGMKEADRYMEVMAKFLTGKPEQVANNLSDLMEKEWNVLHQRGVARQKPKKAKRGRDPKEPEGRVQGTLDAQGEVIEAKHIHDALHANAHYESIVMPIMHKIMGWTTHDVAGILPVQRRGQAYRPNNNEAHLLYWSLQAIRQEVPAAQYTPVKEWFQDHGFSFDNEGDLLWKTPRRLPPGMTEQKRFSPQELSQTIQRETTEKAFGKGMSPEQRKALKALERRDPTFLPRNRNPLALRRTVGPWRTPHLTKAGTELTDLLNTSPLTSLDTTLKQLGASLPLDHTLAPLVRRLLALNMNIQVQWHKHMDMDLDTLGTYQVLGGQGVIKLNRRAFEANREPAADLVHAVLHEAVHAATAGALQKNRGYRLAFRALMLDVTRHLATQRGTDISQHYGLTSVEEFVAEAFSNPTFQAVLRSIDFGHYKYKTAWQRLVDLVKKILGMQERRDPVNALELVMMTTNQLFTGEQASEGTSLNLQKVDVMKQYIGDALDKVDRSGKLRSRVGDAAYDMLEGNSKFWGKGALSASTMEQMDRRFTDSFGKNTGPLHQYLKTFFQRNADNAHLMERGIKLSHRWDALIEKHGPDHPLEMSRIASEATLYGIHPDEPLTPVRTTPKPRRKKGQPKGPPPAPNEHVQSALQRQRHAELSARFDAMPADVQQLYRELKEYYRDTLQTEIDLHVVNALRAMLGEQGFTTTEADVSAKNLHTVEGLEKEFGKQLSPEERSAIAKIGRVPQRHVGPYFPLMRPGEHIVTARRHVETQHFSDKKAARAWRREQKASDPTLTVSHVIGDDISGYTVTVHEKETRIAESPSEIQHHYEEMVAEYGEGNVTLPQTKANLYQQEGTAIKSDSSLRLLLGKLEGNGAAQAALKDFYLRSTSDKSFRKREIKRTNRRGVNYDNQQRTLAAYSSASSYYISQLRYGWKLGKEMVAMNKFAEDVANPGSGVTSDLSPVKLREVVDELHRRDSFVRDPDKLSTFARRTSSIAQLFLLLSPSYWMINMSQPYMVSLPWLAARTSMGDATAALASAQKMIAHPLIQQAGESKGGLKSLWSKSSTNRAFSVVDQLIEHIGKGQNPRKDEYTTLLHTLKRAGIIDMTSAAELRVIAEGKYSWRQRILDASRVMSHLTEVNNRAMTGIAAYDLYRAKGESIANATEFAKQAVSITQFNYSGANSPRLFGENGPFGRYGPVMFQFMKYPQHIWAMLIGSFRMLVKGGMMEKKVALRTLGGLFATHFAMTGLTGAMLQPLKWAVGLALWAFGDDDEDFASAMSGKAYERWMRRGIHDAFDDSWVGKVLATGAPGLINADLTQRMSLGQLYMIDLNPDTSESLMGSLVGSFGGAAPNMFMGWGRGLQYLYKGQTAKGMEYLMPKAMKDVSRAFRLANEGLTDATGKEIMGAEEMTPSTLFWQSMGVQPANLSEKYSGRSAITTKRDRERRMHNLWLQRYNAARSDEERAEVLQGILEFNEQHPLAKITLSQRIKSRQQYRRSEARMRLYGADLRRTEVGYAEEGEPYDYPP